MDTPRVERLRQIKSFPSLVKYLRDDLGWPIDRDDFDEVTFDYEPEELGLDPKMAVKLKEIKQLRPLASSQPFGIFFLSFEPKQLQVTVLRRILSSLVVRKRASANKPDLAAWNKNDLLFISAYGEEDQRTISFAHFVEDEYQPGDLPKLLVLGWDNRDTIRHLADADATLTKSLRWPDREDDADAWREQWSAAFTLRHREVIDTAKKLAVRLAGLARDIRSRVNAVLVVESRKEGREGPLRKLQKSFREALIHDLSDDDFADMYAQTIAYGLLSARVSRPAGLVAENLTDMVPITNPFLKELLETFLHVGGRKRNGNRHIDFDELGVTEVVELLRAANMEAVLRDFGDRNPTEDPVIHFYEHFLKEYDAKKRMQRGVFYTPRPIVSYIVRSVHELLQTEFGLDDGLADTATWGDMLNRHTEMKLPTISVKEDPDKPSVDIPIAADTPFVQILDPATGTGTFLVEVIDVVHKTMIAKWEKQGHLPLTEIPALWNDYVSKHLLPRLHGYELMMAPYAIAHMKIGLKLDETGYRFTTNERARVYLTNALEPAQSYSDRLAFDAPALAHEAQAVNTIKELRRFTVVIGNPPYANFGQLNRNPFILNLLDDYKRGLNERKLNLDDDYLKFFRLGQFVIGSAGTGVLGMITNSSFLDGLVHRKMRESLFEQFTHRYIANLYGNSRRGDVTTDGSTDENVFDIQQGVAVSLFGMCRWMPAQPMRYHAFSGRRDQKYQGLASRTVLSIDSDALKSSPEQFFFIPQNTSFGEEYASYTALSDVFSIIGSGLNTDRDELCVDFDRARLSERMQQVFAGQIDETFCESFNFRPSSSYDPVALAKRQSFDPSALRICIYRPFDFRHIYYKVGFTSRPVFDVQSHMLHRNLGLLVCRQSKEPFAVLATRHICTHKIVAVYDRTSLAPLWCFQIKRSDRQAFTDEANGVPCFTPTFAKALSDLLRLRRGMHGLPENLSPEDIFHYAYAVFYSPFYRRRYAEFLRTNYPRLPMTENLELFRMLARLGGELVALHLLESPKLNQPRTEFIGRGSPEVEKVSWSKNIVWIDKAQKQGFRGVSEDVWNFHIGGYQVCQKWLKDRKGRTLTAADITHYHRIVIALQETIRLMKEIDEVINKHGGWPAAFTTEKP